MVLDTVDEGGQGEKICRKWFTEFMTLTNSQFQVPEHEFVSIGGQDSDSEATSKVREVFQKLAAGRYGKKVLLKFDQ